MRQVIYCTCLFVWFDCRAILCYQQEWVAGDDSCFGASECRLLPYRPKWRETPIYYKPKSPLWGVLAQGLSIITASRWRKHSGRCSHASEFFFFLQDCFYKTKYEWTSRLGQFVLSCWNMGTVGIGNSYLYSWSSLTLTIYCQFFPQWWPICLRVERGATVCKTKSLAKSCLCSPSAVCGLTSFHRRLLSHINQGITNLGVWDGTPWKDWEVQ